MGLSINQQRNKIRANRKPEIIMGKKVFSKRDKRKQDSQAVALSKRRARDLVKNATKAELLLKDRLEKNDISHKFQSIIRKRQTFFIADFLIDNLVIELDGSYHLKEKQKKKDARRTRTLKKWGYEVIRFTNKQVFTQLPLVIDRIEIQLDLMKKNST